MDDLAYMELAFEQCERHDRKGYHWNAIPRGDYGELSKIKEEVLELEDAIGQGNKVMALVELSDLVGAIKGYVAKHFGEHISVDDLIKMSEATARAFETGQRGYIITASGSVLA